MRKKTPLPPAERERLHLQRAQLPMAALDRVAKYVKGRAAFLREIEKGGPAAEELLTKVLEVGFRTKLTKRERVSLEISGSKDFPTVILYVTKPALRRGWLTPGQLTVSMSSLRPLRESVLFQLMFKGRGGKGALEHEEAHVRQTLMGKIGLGEGTLEDIRDEQTAEQYIFTEFTAEVRRSLRFFTNHLVAADQLLHVLVDVYRVPREEAKRRYRVFLAGQNEQLKANKKAVENALKEGFSRREISDILINHADWLAIPQVLSERIAQRKKHGKK